MKQFLLLFILSILGHYSYSQILISPAPNGVNGISLTSAQTYINLTNQGSTPITTSLSISGNPQNISIGINRCSTIRAKQTCYIIVSFNGYKTSLPSISVNLQNNSNLLAKLTYNPNNVESILVSPSSINLGTITAEGLSSPNLITVQNTGNVSVTPTPIISDPNLQVSSNTCIGLILPTNSCSFIVRYNALSSTPNGSLNGLTFLILPSALSLADPSAVLISGNLNLSASIPFQSANYSSGGAVSGDQFVKTQGYSSVSYNAVSNKFYYWGVNYLNLNPVSSPSTPQIINFGVLLGGKTLDKIAYNSVHSCAIASDSNAYCWGSNSSGQLGVDTNLVSVSSSLIPYPVSKSGVLSGKTIKDIGVGQGFSCAIASDDKVYCWGVNDSGQLGNGDVNRISQPEPVAVNDSGVLAGKAIKKLNVEKYKVCVIASDDKVYCWGGGLLGNGLDHDVITNINGYLGSEFPVAVSMTGDLSTKTVKFLSTSGNTNCLISNDDKAYCWGNNGQGQLTDGTTNYSFIPVPINDSGALAGKSIKDIKSSGSSVFALTTDNKLFAWGSNGGGAMGTNGPLSDSQLPTEIYMAGDLSGKTIKSFEVSSNDSMGCVIASDDKAYCWGVNFSGILGLGIPYPTMTQSLEPKMVAFGGSISGTLVKSIAMEPFYSMLHVCALGLDNNVYCWGQNNAGQLGDGTKVSKPYPVLAPTP